MGEAAPPAPRGVEECLRAAFEEAGEAMVVVDTESGRILDCNARMCELHGYGRDELLGLSIIDLVGGEEVAARREEMGRLLRETGRYADDHVLHRRKDGTVFPCAIRARLVEAGGRRFTVGVFRDLTEKVRATEFFRVLFEKSPDGAFLVQDEGLRLVEANEALCRLLGYAREELLSLTVPDLVPPRRRHLVPSVRAKVRGQAAFERSRRILLRKDGGEVLTDHMIARMEYGGRIYYLVTVRDVTEQARLEREVEEARTLLAKFRDEAPDPMYELDARGRFRYINAAGLRVLGWRAEEAVGRSFTEATPPERLELHREMFERALRGEIVRFRSEVIGAGGVRVPIEINGGPLPLPEGPGTMGVARLIGEQVRAERELAEARKFLEHVLEGAGDGFILTDDRGVVLLANQKAVEILAIPRDILVGRGFLECASPENRESLAGHFARLQAGQPVRLEVRHRRDPSGERILDVTASSLEREGRRYVFAILRDTTERVRAEEALRESEERWQQLVKNAPDQILTFDRQGTILFVNRVLEGWEPGEVVGASLYRFVAPEHHGVVREAMERFFRSGEPQTLEIRALGERRGYVWNLVRVSPLRRGGEVVAGLAIVSDISGRRREEERAAARHAVARVLMESPPVSEVLSRILRAVGESLGWKAGVFWKEDPDAGGLRPLEVWLEPPGCPEEVLAQLRGRVLRPGEWIPGRAWAGRAPVWVPDLALDRDGVLAAAAGFRTAVAFPVWGSGGGILGVIELLDREARDPDPAMLELAETLSVQVGQFVERRRAEEALRFQKVLLESQSEASVDGILVVSTAGTVASFNRRFQAMWDLPPELLRGGPAEAVWGHLEERLAEPRTFLDRVRRPSEQELREELRLRDGRAFECYGAPVRSPDGVHYGRVYFFRDITGRKRAEEGLRRAVEDARRAYEELRQAQAQLIRSEKLASVGMLVAGVAHQINNPLNVIYGNLRLLKEEGCGRREFGAAARRRFRRMLEDALRGAEQARRIIEDFRNFARDTGTAGLVDVNRCLEETLEVLGRQLPPGVEVVRRFGPVPPVRGFRGQLNQVFFNLVKNAVEAVGAKGRVTLATRRGAGRVVVEVEDTGPGIPGPLRKKIFEPFFTTKAPGKGMGLGLSISAMIVHNHGGRIAALGRRGKGALFRVTLPVPPEARRRRAGRKN